MGQEPLGSNFVLRGCERRPEPTSEGRNPGEGGLGFSGCAAGCPTRPWRRSSELRAYMPSHQLVWRHWQIANTFAGRMKDSVADRCSRPCNSNFADATSAHRIQLVIRDVQRLDVDLRDIG